jgi:hypothetical protein
MKRLDWPLPALTMMALALILFAAPSRFEGPVLVPISPGHALSVLDLVALLPLLVGASWIYAGLWSRRETLYELTRQAPPVSLLGTFTAGTGLGLLLASAWSSFFWWWAVGALLFGTVSLLVLFLLTRRERAQVQEG